VTAGGFLVSLAAILLFGSLGFGTIWWSVVKFDEMPCGLTAGQRFAYRALLVGAVTLNPFSAIVVAVIFFLVNLVMEIAEIVNNVLGFFA
jgi:hypothetical protein